MITSLLSQSKMLSDRPEAKLPARPNTKMAGTKNQRLLKQVVSGA